MIVKGTGKTVSEPMVHPLFVAIQRIGLNMRAPEVIRIL